MDPGAEVPSLVEYGLAITVLALVWGRAELRARAAERRADTLSNATLEFVLELAAAQAAANERTAAALAMIGERVSELNRVIGAHSPGLPPP